MEKLAFFHGRPNLGRDILGYGNSAEPDQFQSDLAARLEMRERKPSTSINDYFHTEILVYKVLAVCARRRS